MGNSGVAVAIVLYCIAGTSLTILNKLVMIEFPYPSLVLLLQCFVTLLLVVPMSKILPPSKNTLINPLESQKVRMWMPQVLFFFAMLLTSMIALKHVNVVTLTVIRNLISLVVCAVDMGMLGTKMSNTAIGSLFGILFGALMYGYGDLTFNIIGYIWLLANIVASSAFNINIKKLVKTVDLSTFGMVFYNNLLCLPFFAVVGMSSETEFLDSISDLSAMTQAALWMSCLFGFLLSTIAFYLNQSITATSLMVVNNCNKFAMILFSELFVESTLGSISLMGTIVVMGFGALYSYDKTAERKPPAQIDEKPLKTVTVETPK